MRSQKFKVTNRTSAVMYYVSAVGFVFALLGDSWRLLPWAILLHVAVVSLFSAVTHRYFCHRSYEANPFLMWVLSIVPVLYNFSTPIQWAAMHAAHHAYADTDKDPHGKGWTGLFTAGYKAPPAKFAVMTKWFLDPKHKFVYENAVLITAAYQIALLFVSFDAFLWLGLTPIFTVTFCSGLHRVFSHTKDGVVTNRWYLEFVAPVGGEWIHDEHHANAKKAVFSNKWYELDTGGLFVKLLQKRSAQ